MHLCVLFPQVFMDPTQPDMPEEPSTHVLEDEQADLYCCWAESVLLKFRWVAAQHSLCT